MVVMRKRRAKRTRRRVTMTTPTASRALFQTGRTMTPTMTPTTNDNR